MRSNVVDTDYSQRVEVPRAVYGPPAPPQRPDYRQRPTLSTPPVHTHRLSLAPEEGWLALILLGIAIYCVTWSIIAANWVTHSTMLLWSPLPGLLAGLLVAKIPRFPQAVLHLAAVLLGHWFSIFLTSVVAFHVPWLQLLGSIRAIITGGLTLSPVSIPDSEIVFFFYLSFLCFFLGYFGSWLIYRAHLPWLVALVYTSILLVNLNYVHYELLPVLITLLGTLGVLIARIQLAGQVAHWKKEGLHTDRAWMRGITWRCMQIGCVLTLLGLLLGYLLPAMSQPAAGRTFWDGLNTAWTNIINGRVSWQNLGSITQPYQTPTNVFGSQMTISGTVSLPMGEVLHYTSSGGPHYLEGFTYDHFDGHTWSTSLSSGDTSSYDANGTMPPDNVNAGTTQITTTVKIVQAPLEDKPYLFAPAQPIRFDVNTIIYSDSTAVAWTQQSPLVAGETYNAVSMLPLSDVQQLTQTPLPTANSDYWQGQGISSNFIQRYLKLPDDLAHDSDSQLVQQWAGSANDTYTALKMIEQHLSDTTYFTYSVSNPPVPGDMDVVDWLLKTHKGYCTYYASAMAIMGRILNIPTRVVNGFSQGHYDAKRKVWVVNGDDAHSWVQAYFPNIGWISFDPTPGFSMNGTTTPTPTPSPVATVTPSPPAHNITPTPISAKPTPKPGQQPPASDPKTGAGNTGPSQGMLLGFSLSVLFFSVIIFLAALLNYWWRSMYAQSSFVAGTYWRLCRIASWAGLAPRGWQTPYEYSGMLGKRFPQNAPSLWRLTELFVRDRYGPPHAASDATETDARQLWSNLRGLLPRLFLRKKR